MTPLDKQARIAGLLYLVVAITGPFILLYVPGRLFVPGDAGATAGNILANEGLFRAYIVTGIVSQLFFIATVLALYRLLEGVHRTLAAVMVLLILIDSPLAFIGIANQVATLSLLHGGDFLAAFDQPQRDALAVFLVYVDGKGVLVSEIFWGLWLLPLGVLVYRSGFLPRFLGIWLFVNGIAYIVLSLTGILAPAYAKSVGTATLPVLFGELALTLWLLIRGVKQGNPENAAPAAG
jgi:hypothetical protein